MSEQVITFPQLDEKVKAYTAELHAKGIGFSVIKDEVSPQMHGCSMRKVLIADYGYMKSFVQLWIDTIGPLDQVTETEVSADDARAFVEYLLDKQIPR